MAIIIVAICFFLLILSILVIRRIQIKQERKILRNFYDILFLIKFFKTLEREDLVESILRNGEKICVIRKILVKHQSYSETRRGNLKYSFIVGKNTFEFFGKIEQNPCVKSLYNSEFELKVKKKRIDICFNDSYEDFICVNSAKTIFQSLLILFESEVELFEMEEFVFCSKEEIVSVKKIIEEIRLFLLGEIGV